MRETIAAPRADRMLLRIHYLRIVGPLAAACLGSEILFMVVAAVVERLQVVRGDLSQGLDVMAVLLSLFMALPVGASVFSRPFKEQHVLLFYSLPISRLRQWTIFAAASLLALLTVQIGLALLRPNAIRLLGGDLRYYAAALAIAFAAGLCFGLVFVRPVFVYVAAHVAAVLGPLLVAVSLLSPMLAYERDAFSVEPVNAAGAVMDVLRVIPGPYVATPMAMLIAAFLVASALFYVRGEVALPRVQFRNAAAIVVAMIAIAALAGPLVYGFAGGGRRRETYRIARDGAHVAVRSHGEGAPWRKSLAIIDATTGAKREWTLPGATWFDWTPAGELVTVTREVSPLRRLWYLLPPRDAVSWWSSGGEKLGEHGDGPISAVTTLPDGTIRVAVREGRGIVIRELRRAAPSRDILQISGASRAELVGDLVQAFSDEGSRVWRIERSGARELPRLAAATETDELIVYEDVFYPSAEALVKKIESSWPPPRAAGEHVSYAVGAGEMPYLFAAVRDAGMSTFSIRILGGDKRWRTVVTAVPLAPAELQGASTVFGGGPSGVVLAARGIAVFRQPLDGMIAVRLYDAARDTTTTLWSAPDENAPVSVFARSLRDAEGQARIECVVGGIRRAEFLWHDGKVVPTRGSGFLAASTPNGDAFYETGGSLVRVSAGGAVTRVLDFAR